MRGQRDREIGWEKSPHRDELFRLYQETDRVMSSYSCDASTDCCRFGVTGREPYPTATEAREVVFAFTRLGRRPSSGPDTAGGRVRGKRLPIADERRCPALSDEGRCRIYASRPFGCRTFICSGALGGRRLPREALSHLSRAIADLSARFAPHDSGARPLTNVLHSR